MKAKEILNEEEIRPYIESHISGNVAWIDMFYVPRSQRRQGMGYKMYQEWETSLPKNIKLIRLFSSDTGGGQSSEFWLKLGFDFQYDGENLDYETSNYMWKGVNGVPTPEVIYIDGEDN